MFKDVILDLEANGLFNWVTKEKPDTIHCAVIKDIHKGNLLGFIPKEFLEESKLHKVKCVSLEEFPNYIKNFERVIGHNLITYDVTVIKEILNIEIPLKNIEDTLIMSQLSAPQREGGHSLDSWGKRVKRFKPSHNDWSKFSFKMLTRCSEDVEINYLTYKILKKDLSKFSNFSIRLEHKVRQLMFEQEVRGCPLDEEKAHKLMVEIKEKAENLKKEIQKDFKPRSKLIREVTPKYTKEKIWTGNYTVSPKTGRKVKEWKEVDRLSSVGLRKFTEEELKDNVVSGPFSLFQIEEFNLNSPSQIVERMDEAGWEPYIFTKKGAPKVCEENLNTLPEDAPESAKNLALWKMCETRWKLFESYLDNTDVDGNIHGSVNPLGTRTMRMAHSGPNLGNVPSKKAPYGKEARECFFVKDPEKEVMVGADASGIQLRALAHYIGSESYIEKICGADPHAEHGYILEFIRKGENDPEIFDDGRSKSKTFIYSWLFGAGDRKLGTSLGGNAQLGKEKKELFYSGVEGLREFLERKARAASKGYMKGLDGRLYKIPSDHLALPCYLQGFEQVIMKYAMVLYHNELHKLQIPFRQVLMVHDEFEAITQIEYGDIVGKTMVDSIIKAGKYFDSKCPLDGEYKLGKNWYEVH